MPELMPKRILVILGHPSPDSFCAALAAAYVDGARSAGHEVQLLALNKLAFDPVLHTSYTGEQTLEPDLQAAQSAILRAQHLVFVYPLWWGGLPALLKGFMDRVFLPGFAFRYLKGSSRCDRLLTGRSARLLVTMDTPPWYLRWVYRRPGHRQMKQATLEFCGISPVRISSLGVIKGASEKQLKNWLNQAEKLGGRGD